METLVFGWDVSTAVIGVCVKDQDTGKSVFYQSFLVTGDTMLKKYDTALSAVDYVCRNMGDRFPNSVWRHFVEDRLGNFTKGATMQQTLMKLAQMNAVVSHHLSLVGEVVHIHPSTAKRIAGLHVPKGGDKKEAAISLARTSDDQFPFSLTKKGNPVAGTADMADAWLLATTGRKLLRGEATLEPNKKAGRRNRKPRATDTSVSLEE